MVTLMCVYACFRRHLNGNRISGTLPPMWWMGNFHVLALTGNRIEGPLPVSWANMEHIEVLDLARNRLTGILPNVIRSVCRSC